MEQTENEILVSVLNGDIDKFSFFVKKYQNMVFSIAQKYSDTRTEAEDIVQEIFIKAFDKLDTYNQKAKFSTWLYRLSVNFCIDHLRKKKSNKTLKKVDKDIKNIIIPKEDDLENNIIRKEKKEYVIKLLDKIKSKKQKEIFCLILIENLSIAEVGSILGIDASTVRTHLFRGLKKIKRYINYE